MSHVSACEPRQLARQRPISLPSRLRRQAELTLDRLSQTSFGTAKAYYNNRCARNERQHRAGPPLLIYTMGKVGSSSIFLSLRQLGLRRLVDHVHFLDLEYLNQLEASLKPAYPDSLVNLRHVWRSQRHAQELTSNPDARVQAISLIRDPLARNLSNFFQQIVVKPLPGDGNARWRVVSSYYGFESTVRADKSGAPDAHAPGMRELIELFFDRVDHDFHVHWLEHELSGMLDIDVYASPFPTDKGYAIYHSDRADVLLFRLRDLNRSVTQAVHEFLGFQDFCLNNANVGDRKAYADVYQAFKASIVFPSAFLDRMYDSRFARHFYTESERQALRAQWTTDAPPAGVTR
jgi:hypothetical protein